MLSWLRYSLLKYKSLHSIFKTRPRVLVKHTLSGVILVSRWAISLYPNAFITTFLIKTAQKPHILYKSCGNQNSCLWPKAGFSVTDKSLLPFLLPCSGSWALGSVTGNTSGSDPSGRASINPSSAPGHPLGVSPKGSPRLRDLSGLPLLLHGAVCPILGFLWLWMAPQGQLDSSQVPRGFFRPKPCPEKTPNCFATGSCPRTSQVDPLDISAGNIFLDLSSVPPGRTDIQKGVWVL